MKITSHSLDGVIMGSKYDWKGTMEHCSETLKEFGIKHEEKIFIQFKEKYKSHAVITSNGDENQRAKETITAMEKGVEFIYHAYFVDKEFRGEADFLIKTNKASKKWKYSYEVFDTKISRKIKPRHAQQITAYSYFVEKIQKG